MDATKIRLSPEEKELLMRPDWILTKNRVLQKAWQLLEQLQFTQQNILDRRSPMLPEEIYKVSAKVSKGENYQGLPYLILDQPRHFNKDHIFAIRTFFWWGHFFSSTLQLSGDYKKLYGGKIIASFDKLKEAGFFVCVNADQWEHHFETDNFMPSAEITKDQFAEIIENNSFIKLSKKIPLQEWDNAEDILAGIFNNYLLLLEK